MAEQADKKYTPKWVPVPPPTPATLGERLRQIAERYGFIVVCALVLAALAALFVLFSLAKQQGEVDLDALATEAETLRTQRAEGASYASERETATLRVTSQPAGAVVLLNRDTVGVTPLDVGALRPGAYQLVARKEAYAPVDTFVFIRDAQPKQVALTLRRSPAERPEAPSEAPPSEDTPPARAAADEVSAEREAPGQPEAEQPEAEPAAPTTGQLIATSQPPGARVTLDGTVAGTTPLTTSDVSAGTHEAVFTLEGYETVRRRVTVEAGQDAFVQADLAERTGLLVVRVEPWGSIYVDGTLRERDTDVQHRAALPVGTHRVRATHPTFGAAERTVEVRPGDTTRVVIDFNAPTP